MAQIVNLRTVRKQKRRQQAAEDAAQNRLTFGRPKSERQAHEAEKARQNKDWAGKRLETSDEDEEEALKPE